MLKKFLSLPRILLKKYLMGIILWLIVVWIMFYQIFQDKWFRQDIVEFWLPIEIIYRLIIGWIAILIVILLIWVWFLSFIRYTNKNIWNLEKAIFFNINTICLILVSSITILKYLYLVKINDQTYLTVIGGIVIFWWWYKKYQRDKEVDLFQKFFEKDISYKSEILKTNKKNDIKNLLEDLLFTWEEMYTFQDKNYISYTLWEEFKFRIKESIVKLLFLTSTSKQVKDSFIEILEDRVNNLYYKANRWSSYRFIVYIIEQIRKTYNKKELLILNENKISENEDSKIQNLLSISDKIINIPDIMYEVKMKNKEEAISKIKQAYKNTNKKTKRQ